MTNNRPDPPRRWSYTAVVTITGPVSSATEARRYGVCRRTIFRWRAHGIPDSQADQVAVVGLGLHPVNVWPDWR